MGTKVWKKLKWVVNGEVCQRFTSSQRHEYIIQMTLWSKIVTSRNAIKGFTVSFWLLQILDMKQENL
jgi:hypothetical protein